MQVLNWQQVSLIHHIKIDIYINDVVDDDLQNRSYDNSGSYYGHLLHINHHRKNIDLSIVVSIHYSSVLCCRRLLG